MVATNYTFFTIDDYEKAASAVLNKMALDYYNGGADDEITLHRNRNAYAKYLIRPLSLRNAKHVDTRVDWLGLTTEFPIAIAPTAFHRMANDNGELATVSAARETGTLMVSSSWATTPLEDVARRANGNPLWFQLYVYQDRSLSDSLVRRAQQAGYKALILTVDTPVLGNRNADAKNRFTLPPPLEMANFALKAKDVTAHGSDSGLMDYVKSQIDPTLTWQDLARLVKTSSLPVIVKGIMRGDDALRAIQWGAKGIIVSNHGGRQLDGAPATLEMLSEIVRAVDGKVPVWVDGGIRSGRDAFKAIALGAKGVFIGRPIIWGLATAGQKGVAEVIRLLQKEFVHTMQLAGVHTLDELHSVKDLVVHENYYHSKL